MKAIKKIVSTIVLIALIVVGSVGINIIFADTSLRIMLGIVYGSVVTILYERIKELWKK